LSASLLVAVAYSGGRDSTALLYATLQQARTLDVTVLALHVHHGLSPNAQTWLDHGKEQCQRWSQQGYPVEFIYRQLTPSLTPGQSVEAWAREQRYLALAEMAREAQCSCVMLAQHRRDQAETFLLQALRGSGPAGLASMAKKSSRFGITWLRPWLNQPRESIDAYCAKNQLNYIDDESNLNTRFSRNRLRHWVWPALQASFPDAEQTLSATASWAQEALECLEELAQQDLARVHDSLHGGLQLALWRELSLPRRSLLLRTWFKQQVGSVAASSLIQRLMVELTGLSGGSVNHPLQWPLPAGMLVCNKDVLQWVKRNVCVAEPSYESTLNVTDCGRYTLADWGGVLSIEPVLHQGVTLDFLRQHSPLILRRRQGGERFQWAENRPARSLKKQYQLAEIPAWQRMGPLVWAAKQLIFVPGLGMDARVHALPGQHQVGFVWEPLPVLES
jgi:tRNA(Ile)-lysidine synthase